MAQIGKTCPQEFIQDTYIIFGTSLSSSEVDSTSATDSPFKLQTYDWVVFQGTGAEWGWRQKTNYKTLDELYSFFKANGLTVQEEEKKK